MSDDTRPHADDASPPDEIERSIDELARRSASSVRLAPDERRLEAAVRTGRRTQTARLATAAALVGVLAIGGTALLRGGPSDRLDVTGVTEPTSSPTTSDDPTSPTAVTTSTPTVEPTLALAKPPVPLPTAPVEQLDEAAAAERMTAFLGADGTATGDPIRLGVATTGELANNLAPWIRLVNDRFGGLTGRPLELVPCDVEADPTGCAESFAGDDSMPFVLADCHCTQEFIADLALRKPVMGLDGFSNEGVLTYRPTTVDRFVAGFKFADSLFTGDGTRRILVLAERSDDPGEPTIDDIPADIANRVELVEIEGTFATELAASITEKVGREAPVAVVSGHSCDRAPTAFELAGVRPIVVSIGCGPMDEGTASIIASRPEEESPTDIDRAIVTLSKSLGDEGRVTRSIVGELLAGIASINRLGQLPTDPDEVLGALNSVTELPFAAGPLNCGATTPTHRTTTCSTVISARLTTDDGQADLPPVTLSRS